MNAGPNTYPVGARVCNTGDEAALNLVFSLIWDQDNANISLMSPSSISLSQLDATNCRDFYFQVLVNRTDASYDSSRDFHFTLIADGGIEETTDLNTEIYVQPYLNENGQPDDNMTDFVIGGPSLVEVGQIVQFTGASTVAFPGMQQLMHLIELDPDFFRILSIETSYTIPTVFAIQSNYADGCGWDSDATNPDGTYRTCIGPPLIPSLPGLVGGTTLVTYTVEAIAAGATTLNGGVFSYSAGEYIYQPNSTGLVVNVVDELPNTETPTPTQTETATATST